MTSQDPTQPTPSEQGAESAPELSEQELAAVEQIFDLARQGRAEQLAPLLAAGVPANLTNANGDTLLILAAYREQPDVVRLLLEHGADTDRLNDRGQTALVSAVFRNHEPIVRMLLEAGADASLGHQTPEAVAAFFALPEMTRLLAEHRGRA